MALRVLCITPWFPNSPDDPFYNYIYRSVLALGARGITTTVLVTRPWTPRVFGLVHRDWIRPALQIARFESTLGLHVRRYGSIPRDLWPEVNRTLYRMSVRSVLARLIREGTPDVIHAHTEGAGSLAVPVGREFGLPVVVTLHGINAASRPLGAEARHRILRGTLLEADKVVLVGEPLRPHFRNIAGRDDHFRVIPNGFFLPSRLRESDRGGWGNHLRFISVSNLHEGKGIELTLQALAKLRSEGHADWSYRIVGGGHQRNDLDRLVQALDLVDKVQFTGIVAHDRTLAMLEEADVFVLPSYREAFGVAYLEAMGSGLLTVGVKGQGPSAFIRDRETGLLVEPRDVESLAQALRSVFNERELMHDVAKAGQRLAWGEYTWDRHAEKLTAVYEEALRESRGRTAEGPGHRPADDHRNRASNQAMARPRAPRG